jgi:NitT/TauT family transport system substrate-binding protein
MLPQGSPEMTVLGLSDKDYRLDMILGPDSLVAAFGSQSHDVIIAPTNLGAKLFQSKETYQLAAVLVWGNYHLVSTSFQSLELSEVQGKDILVFGQNQTSDIIIKHLLNAFSIDANVTYVDSVANAAALYLNDPTKVVMVAEPSLSRLKSLVPETKSIDLQTLYQSLYGSNAYPQAGLFIKQGLSTVKVNQLLEDIASSITSVNAKEEKLLERGVAWGLAPDKDIFSSAIDGSHLFFAKPEDVMDDIHTYFSIILDMNPGLIGGSLPNDRFYWSDVQ